MNIESRARADIEICGGKYQLQFGLMPDLCADVILDRQFLSRYSEVTLCYGGSDPPLRIPCAAQLVLGVAAAKLKQPRIFKFLAPDCKPVAAKSRRYSQEDSNFIKSEIVFTRHRCERTCKFSVEGASFGSKPTRW